MKGTVDYILSSAASITAARWLSSFFKTLNSTISRNNDFATSSENVNIQLWQFYLNFWSRQEVLMSSAGLNFQVLFTVTLIKSTRLKSAQTKLSLLAESIQTSLKKAIARRNWKAIKTEKIAINLKENAERKNSFLSHKNCWWQLNMLLLISYPRRSCR